MTLSPAVVPPGFDKQSAVQATPGERTRPQVAAPHKEQDVDRQEDDQVDDDEQDLADYVDELEAEERRLDEGDAQD